RPSCGWPANRSRRSGSLVSRGLHKSRRQPPLYSRGGSRIPFRCSCETPFDRNNYIAIKYIVPQSSELIDIKPRKRNVSPQETTAGHVLEIHRVTTVNV